MTRVRLLLVIVSLTGIAIGGRTADAQPAAAPAVQPPAPGARGGGRGGPPVVSPGDRGFVKTLQGYGVRHTYVETEGRHEWTVWRQYLRDVVPLLFR